MSEAVAIHKMSGYTALILNLSLLMKRSICKPKAIYTEMRGFFLHLDLEEAKLQLLYEMLFGY